MWGRPVNFITFFVICPGQGRFSRIARFIRGREGWARSGRSSRQRGARIGTRRGQKRGRRGSGTREFIRGQDRCADMCSDLKSEMKIRRFENRKFIRGEDRSGREKCERNDKVVLSRSRERCGGSNFCMRTTPSKVAWCLSRSLVPSLCFATHTKVQGLDKKRANNHFLATAKFLYPSTLRVAQR